MSSWALCMRQSCIQGNCWAGSMMSNFTFQSNCEHSLIAQSLLAAESTPHSGISLSVTYCTLLKQLPSFPSQHSGVGTVFVSFCSATMVFVVLCFWNTGHGTPVKNWRFEQADKELCFSPFGSVCVTSQNVSGGKDSTMALPWVQSPLCCLGLSWNNQSNTKTASATSGNVMVKTI